MGYDSAPGDEINQLFTILKDFRRRLAELERPTGSQTASALRTLQDLVNGLLTQVNGVFSGYVQAGGNLTVGGQGHFTGYLYSVGSSTIDLSSLAGLRQGTWQLYTGANTGLFGYAPSTLASKTNLSESLPFTAEDVYATIPFVYEYIGQVAIRDDPQNPEHDPEYPVPSEIGLIAEHLIARNMGVFVVFNEDGTAKTIDYPLFGAVANLVAVRDLDSRLKAAGL